MTHGQCVAADATLVRLVHRQNLKRRFKILEQESGAVKNEIAAEGPKGTAHFLLQGIR